MGNPPLFWHLYTFETLGAAEAARGPRSTAVESLGRVWLFTIAPANWQSHSGNRLGRIGPLSLVEADSFAAIYMEGVSEPGMHSMVHRHPGVEA